MKPYDQLVLHAPENDQFGDCQRACIGSLLEINPEFIPHFHETGDVLAFWKAMNTYLATKGLVHLETTPINFKQGQFRGKAECWHMIYGNTSRGTRHAVVARDGVMVHDPHPSREGLLPDDDGGEWTFGFLVKSGFDGS